MGRLLTEIHSIEFTSTPDGEIEVRQGLEKPVLYTRKQVEFTNLMFEYINTYYNEAFEALEEHYAGLKGNEVNYKYKIVHRFIRCNWQDFDDKADIDENCVANFEKVHVNCPLRGECKYWKIICEPQYTSILTDREMLVMEQYYEGVSTSEIADKLHLSIKTVDTHRRNSLKKVGVHSLSEFTAYARKCNLFNKE